MSCSKPISGVFTLAGWTLILCVTANAVPKRNHTILDGKTDGAVLIETPPGAPKEPITVLDDASQLRGGSAGGGLVEAIVFAQPNDSGFGWFMKSDDVLGYGTWATQQIFGNGFAPGDQVSAYDTMLWHSSFDDPILGDASFMTELWDGDPMSIMDTVCTAGGVSAPIPGTLAIFTDVPFNTVVRARAELPAKVTIDCDRVWTVVTLLEGCRAAWRLGGLPGSPWSAPPTIGAANGVWLLYACEQFGACSTANGYNAGTCCNSPETVCDHTDGDFSDCDVNGNAPGALATFCGDGVADYFVALIDEPDTYHSMVSTVFASGGTLISLVPVSVDAPPAAGGSAAGVVSLSDEEVVLEGGGHAVWLEFKIGDWDPDDIGKQLAAWIFTFESNSYATGEQGELTLFTAGGGGTCITDADCEALLGPGAVCDPSFNFPPGTCSPVFVDASREDFAHAPSLGTSDVFTVVDLAIANFRVASVVIVRGPDDPEPYPEAGLYAGTVALYVPADAKGTFTIDMKPWPETALIDQFSEDVPLVSFRPAKITVETGRCCFTLPNRSPNQPRQGVEGCVDELMSFVSCAQMPGFSSFVAGASCDEPCDDCVGIFETDPAEPAPESQALNTKNRYLSFVPRNPGRPGTLFVQLVESAQFPEAVGSFWCVGPPDTYCENGSEIHPPCTPVEGIPNSTFVSASLDCNCSCFDWGSLGGVVHITDRNIVPGAVYQVMESPCTCIDEQPIPEEWLQVATSRFGDTIHTCEGCPCGSPEDTVNIVDCKAVLDRFVNAPCAPLKSRVDLEPAMPDRQINVTDALACIKAFQGLEYDLSVPVGCGTLRDAVSPQAR